MRGVFVDQGRLLSYISANAVPPGDPLRRIRELVRDVRDELQISFGSSRELRTALDPPGASADTDRWSSYSTTSVGTGD